MVSLLCVLPGLGKYHWVKGGLFSANECAFGGVSFGRGHDSGIAIGEQCGFASAELRWSHIGNAGRLTVELHGFIDAGAVRQKGTLVAGEARNASVKSMGVGISLQTHNNLTASVEIGFPMDHPETVDNQDVYRLRSRLQLQL